MITGGKTDIDGALAIMATEFTKNINTIIEDVKAVLEKEDITSFHKDDEGDIKIDISFVQKPMDNIGYITNIIMLLLEAKKSIPGNDTEDDWYGTLCNEQDEIAKKYNEITSYIKNVSNDIMIDELITADYIQSIGEKLIGISDYLDLNENLLFNDKADDDDVSSGGNSNPDESKRCQPTTEQVGIDKILASEGFKNLQKMIDDNNLEYAGRTPLKSLQEVKTLFTECTGGKDLKDYVTWAEDPDYWECRKNIVDAMMCVNELRLNYIKKESKCCAGNKNHREKCNRDIQNVTPYRLSMFHFDHGINKGKKKIEISKLKARNWKQIENELKVIENLKCAWCHAGE